jgi:hypothetical protein
VEAPLFSKMLLHFCRSVILLLLPLCLHAEGELRAYLGSFEGRWVGHFTIHSSATGYSETFPVEQQYWWEDGVMYGVAVSDRTGGLQSARSSTRLEDGQLVSVVKSDSGEEIFIGVLHDGGILWLPVDLARVQDYQMKESIVEQDGVRLLKTDGFDSYIYGDGLAHIVYRGELKFVE